MTSAVLTAETDREAWLAERRKGIGASEISAVLGISPWESPFSLYHRKVHGWDLDLSAEMEWGTRLEPAVIDKFADTHPEFRVVNDGLVVGDPEWMLATPDRMLYMADDTDVTRYPVGLLEVKTAHRADGWGDTGTDDIPVYYRAQVQWQMAVTGLHWAYVAVLIGGSDYREYLIARDDKDIRVMVEAGRRFMARVAAGDAPPLDDHTATLTVVKQLHPDLDDAEVTVSDRIAAGYARACDMARKATAVKRRYEIALRAEMGRAKKATTDAGTFVASRSVYEVAEHTVTGHKVDRLNPPRSKKP
jgi:putative phage-type endonuclease